MSSHSYPAKDGWIANDGSKPLWELVDVVLNCDEPDWPGVDCVRYRERPAEWDWSLIGGGIRITHYRLSSPATNRLPDGK